MFVECKNCQTKFNKTLAAIKRSPNHFCGRSCANSFNNSKSPKRKRKVRTCLDCRENYIHGKIKSIYCKECYDTKHSTNALKSKTLLEIQNKASVKGRHRSWLNSEVRNFNRSWNKGLIKKPCAACKYDKHVELCHIRAITDFPTTATLGEVNHPSNIIQLCRNCHWEFDNGILQLPSRALRLKVKQE